MCSVDPSPAGHRDSDPGRRSLREPALESASAFSGHDVARGASGGNGVGIHDVWFDVRSPAGRLGNAVGGALSDLLFGSLHLPFILPHNAMLYAVLRKAHTILAYLFFLTFIAHFGAILFHTLIVRDGSEADGTIANSYHLITNGMTVMGAPGNDPNSLMDHLEIIRPS